MQIKPSLSNSKFLLKNYFVLQKYLSTILDSSVGFYKILEIGLTLFG
jgi:hypothetical protein